MTHRATLILSLALLAFAAPLEASPTIDSFSPQGYVKQVRQVTVRFSAAMVALGDPRLPDPFRVQCPVPGQGRWADPRNWVYDFDDDLGAGIRCRFTLDEKLHTAAGEPLTGPSVFSFDTGGPAVVASLPRDGWRSLDEDQVFLLRLDAPATQASIEANAYCAVDGVVEKIPLEVLTGSERRAVLDERRALGYDYLQILWKNGARNDVRVRNRSMELNDALIATVRCGRRLPPAAKVLLHWGAGIATASGLTTRTDQQLAFRVRPAFIAQVECVRTNPRAGCVPTQAIQVNFTAPVPRSAALGIRLLEAGGRARTPTLPGAAQAPVVEGVAFAGPFAENSRLTVTLPQDLRDDAGRALENAARFPLQIAVDAYPPLIKFSGNFGILEAREGGILPVTVRHVEPALVGQQASVPGKILRLDSDPQRIAAWLTRVEQAQAPSGEWEESDSALDPTMRNPKLEDQDDDDDASVADRHRRIWRDDTGTHSIFETSEVTVPLLLKQPDGGKGEQVIGIPLKRPGFYVVEFASPTLGAALLGRPATRYVATAALVTDLAVHFEWGRESSLVWVTRLSDGKPVADAAVTVSNLCSGAPLWQGHTDRDGLAPIAESWGDPSLFGNCPWQTHLMVAAAKADDFSFTESTWARGISPYEFGLPVGNTLSAGIYHTVLDRALFRAGETVSMKHFIRRHLSSGVDVPAEGSGAHTVTVAHAGSGERFTLSASFDADGIATGEWKIPPEAKLGEYGVSIDGHPSGEFKVEQFRLPAMHASVSGPAHPLVAPRQIDLDLHVAYLSGGGAGGLAVKLRTQVEPEAVRVEGYPDYLFGGEPVQEGVSSVGTDPAEPEAGASRTQTLPVTLDASGSKRVTIEHLPPITTSARLTAEMEYSDPNGEILTATGTVHLLPASLKLGIRPDSWAGSPGQVRFRVLALDTDGKPRAQQPITAALYQETAYSYRKRLIGGFYSYETTREVKKLPIGCSGTTDAQGLLLCDVVPGVSGQVLVRAETRDPSGAPVGATTSVWVIDQSSWWFGGGSSDRMDVLPEKKEYEAGETARFQVRMPFRQATALVSVEREGVLRRFVTELKGNSPIVEVPIDSSDAPNVFVSVLALRGRVSRPEEWNARRGAGPGGDGVSALVDLNKPAYRLGVAEIKVGWRPHRLDVTVHPEKSTYEIRDHAGVDIAVTRADGKPLAPGTEIAVAAVDEALLDLAPNGSWNLLEAMMGERGLEVVTSTAQMQVVGKRHYGRKAVPQGGGGGRELNRARELFDSLLYWTPRVTLDAAAHAHVSIPLNDSLSSFRIVAVAHSGAQLFGTGSSTINTTQDLILTSGVPPVVREGDRYAATFTLRNTTDHEITAQVTAVSHAAPALQAPASPAAQQVSLAPGQARDLAWPVTAPVGADHLEWRVVARDVNGSAADRLSVSERLEPAFPVRTYQATIAQLSAPLSVPAQIPRGAIEGRGGLEITLQDKLGRLDGVREYMTRYPYICLEQLTSRAVVLRSRADWDALMQRLPAYMDEDGLLKYFPSERLRGDDGLTAYILSIAQESGWPLGADNLARTSNALTRFVEGKIVRDSALPTADLAVRKLQAIDALARYGAARANMLDSIDLEPNLMPTSALIDWIGILAHTPGVARPNERTREALGLLRARLNFQGTTLGFSTERSDALWWLMISTDSNANRMLLAALERPEWRDDIPRLVRGALGRQQFGHWNTTVANAWGVLAMEKFSAAFESVAVTGSTRIDYGTDTHTLAWPLADEASLTRLGWRSGPGTLEITHSGTGAPWALVRATAALPLDRPLSTGFKIVRSVTPVQQMRAGAWTRGDVLRVHLELEAQSDMSWVVVDDPIPGGATVLGSGLGERGQGWAWLAFEERRFDAYRAYYRFVPKGRWSIDYTVRLNTEGRFVLPATRVEAMYAPEMLGEIPNTAVTVEPPSGP